MKHIFEISDAGLVRLKTQDAQGRWVQDIPQIVSTRQACRMLKRSRRHLYRYISRGWLRPAAKFFADLFFDARDITALQAAAGGRQGSVPRWMTPLFPDYDLDALHLKRDADLIISRALDRGDQRAVRWVLRHYSFARRRRFLQTQGLRLLSPRALRFWTWLWRIIPPRNEPAWRATGRMLGGLR